MESHLLVEGKLYGFREKRGRDIPLLKVKLLEKVGRGGRIKVRYEDGPHPGLEEYVHSRQMVVSWSERKRLLRDEEREARLEEAEVGDSAHAEAVATVLGSSGEPSAWAEADGLTMPVAEVERLMSRAGLDGEPAQLHPLGFVDRHGDVHLPFAGAERLARAFAASELEAVVMYIDDREEELRISGNTPGYRYRHDLLRNYAPGFALARQWAGLEQEAEQLRKEIGRLRSLVWTAASQLREAGHESKARRLLRGLEGG